MEFPEIYNEWRSHYGRQKSQSIINGISWRERSYTDKYQESANNYRDDTLQYFSRGLLATAEINIVKFLHLVDLERVLHDTMQHT